MTAKAKKDVSKEVMLQDEPPAPQFEPVQEPPTEPLPPPPPPESESAESPAAPQEPPPPPPPPPQSNPLRPLVIEALRLFEEMRTSVPPRWRVEVENLVWKMKRV